MMSDSNCLTIGSFSEKWPSLPLAEWEETRSTLHIVPLTAQLVADFYHQTMDALRALRMEVSIWTTPVEIEDRTPFQGEFLLPYSKIRTAENPDQTLLAFLQSTYEAGAQLGNWDREALERSPRPNTS